MMEYKLIKPMKLLANLKTVFLAGLILSAANVVEAQNFSIDWYSIDGGGGTSTNTQFSLTGTIGQPDAGHMSGGSFTLEGGFWGSVAAVLKPRGTVFTSLR